MDSSANEFIARILRTLRDTSNDIRSQNPVTAHFDNNPDYYNSQL
jgi:hypothetical protein